VPRKQPSRRRLAVLFGALLWGAGPVLAGPARPPLDLDQYRGKVVYLDFWASWCGPCKLSFPYMQKMVSRYPSSDFTVLAVNVDRQRDRADDFLKQVGNRLPVIYDPTGAIASRFAIKGMPSSVLIGRDGRVRYVHTGFFVKDTPTYDAHIAELIHETR
jgi:thiol-disulfide isomerase/thioredoxin